MRRFEITVCSLLVAFLFTACKADNQSTHGPTAASGTVATRPSSAAGPTKPAVARTPVVAPTVLPAGAQVVAQTTTLGELTRVTGGTPEATGLRRLIDASCQNDLMTIRTSQETILAALPCDRFWNDAAKAQFLGKDASITLEVTADRYRVLIETLAGAQGEFTVDGIWLR